MSTGNEHQQPTEEQPERWYASLFGTTLGPMSHQMLFEMLANGELAPNDLIRSETDSEWRKAGDFVSVSKAETELLRGHRTAPSVEMTAPESPINPVRKLIPPQPTVASPVVPSTVPTETVRNILANAVNAEPPTEPPLIPDAQIVPKSQINQDRKLIPPQPPALPTREPTCVPAVGVGSALANAVNAVPPAEPPMILASHDPIVQKVEPHLPFAPLAIGEPIVEASRTPSSTDLEAASQHQYWYWHESQETGPVSFAELRQRAHQHKLAWHDYVKRHETGEWILAVTVAGLMPDSPLPPGFAFTPAGHGIARSGMLPALGQTGPRETDILLEEFDSRTPHLWETKTTAPVIADPVFWSDGSLLLTWWRYGGRQTLMVGGLVTMTTLITLGLLFLRPLSAREVFTLYRQSWETWDHALDRQGQGKAIDRLRAELKSKLQTVVTRQHRLRSAESPLSVELDEAGRILLNEMINPPDKSTNSLARYDKLREQFLWKMEQARVRLGLSDQHSLVAFRKPIPSKTSTISASASPVKGGMFTLDMPAEPTQKTQRPMPPAIK